MFILMNSQLGVQNQLDHLNPSAQFGSDFLPGGAFVGGSPFMHGTSDKILPRDPGAMVDYYPPFLNNHGTSTPQAVPPVGTVLPNKPSTVSANPVPVLPYPVRQYIG